MPSNNHNMTAAEINLQVINLSTINSGTFNQPQHQHGMIIIMALVILLILSILGISSMSSSTMQERMAANTRDHHIAFQAAEVALRAAEREIEAGLDPPTGTSAGAANGFSTDCTDGLCNCYISTATCMSNSTTANYWNDATTNVWTISSRHRSYNGALSEVAAQPIYIIEFLTYVSASSTTTGTPGPGDPEMYRVTALGFGQSLSARVMLQTTYKKQ